MMRRKIIIVEGMDSTGKDTQIKRILAYFNTEIFHTLHYHAIAGRTKEDARKLSEHTYIQMLDIITSFVNVNFVLNRSHYGEYVYGKLYRDYDDPEYIFDLERQSSSYARKLKADAVLIVFINEDYKELLRREDGDSLSKGKIDMMRQERNRFVTVYQRSIIRPERKIIINTTGKSKKDVEKQILEFLDGVYNG